jgi:hypothetical protein
MSVYSGFVHPSELITRINDAHTRLEQAQEHSEVVRLSTLQIELANAEQEATRLVGLRTKMEKTLIQRLEQLDEQMNKLGPKRLTEGDLNPTSMPRLIATWCIVDDNNHHHFDGHDAIGVAIDGVV